MVNYFAYPILILALLFTFICQAFTAQPKEELKRIKKEIETHKKKLQETKKLEQNLLEELQKVSKELYELEKRIASHREKIKSLQGRINQTEQEIKAYSHKLESRKNYLTQRIRGLQRLYYQPDPNVVIFLTEDDITKALRQIKNMQKILTIDKKLIEQYRQELSKLTHQQRELQNLYASLKAEEKELKEAEQAQIKKKKERERLLAKVQQDKSLYERKIRELEENARRLSRLLEETEKREKRTGKADVKLPESEFTKKKGTLAWPVNGRIIASYGNQRDPVFNVPVFRSGIYIQAPAGTSVKAVAEGKVVYANYFKGYENLVIISHGDGYYTVYGNLDAMNVKEGAFVKTGQVIGTVSDKTNLDSTALYFEIRYRGKPLNPEHWLKR